MLELFYQFIHNTPLCRYKVNKSFNFFFLSLSHLIIFHSSGKKSVEQQKKAFAAKKESASSQNPEDN
jgi:hypothetical protein